MEQTVEKYIDGMPSEAISSISASSVGDTAMLAQMVSAIKQKLFSVATELVSSALKGGDRYSSAYSLWLHCFDLSYAQSQFAQS